MKCKANKCRPQDELLILKDEANLIFLFAGNGDIRVCSVKDASDLGIINESIKSGIIHETKIAETNLLSDEFYRIRSMKNGLLLKAICIANQVRQRTFISLKPGMVVSTMTTGGKYGLFLVKNLADKSLKIDACHILL